MSNWTKKSRFNALLSGGDVDRSLVSAWCHFLEHEQTAQDLAKATIAFTKQYDWDWVKINPRATYLPEVWGNKYDFSDYEWVFPRQLEAVITSTSDLKKILVKTVKESTSLQEQIKAVELIRAGLPDTPLLQTVFSPLSVLLFLTGHFPYATGALYGSNQPVAIRTLLLEDRAGVHQALHAIALTLADYVQELEGVDADGLFYATTGTAHPDLFSEEEFNELSRPYDYIVLNAVKKGKVILHTCGPHASPHRFEDYPVAGISWDTAAKGNVGIEATFTKVKVGGVDHHSFEKSNDETMIRQEIEQAFKKVKGIPFLLSPNCAVSPFATKTLYQVLSNFIKKEND
ncbi:MAG: uroporphyrinogen-III decarboxylase [Bacillaceae bacterium]|nr:uroporphyrinogen-III decarboxylase [Bacillaceae bacterium]